MEEEIIRPPKGRLWDNKRDKNLLDEVCLVKEKSRDFILHKERVKSICVSKKKNEDRNSYLQKNGKLYKKGNIVTVHYLVLQGIHFME